MMKICVAGAGTMGWSIAQLFGAAKYDVLLCDRDLELAQKGWAAMRRALEKRAARGKIKTECVEEICGRVKPGVYAEAADAGFLVEAIYENMKAKVALFQMMDGIMPKNAIFTSNTSSLSITELANAVENPGRFCGMHFFNPATVMKLVEVVGGVHTSEETLRTVTKIAEDIGKTPVPVEESAGFVVNRILIPMINEAVFVLEEGVASAEDIDTAMRLGANHPMGPLALGDLIGLDVVLASMEVLMRETGDAKYRPNPALRKMVRAGKLGRKTGEGFFKYE